MSSSFLFRLPLLLFFFMLLLRVEYKRHIPAAIIILFLLIALIRWRAPSELLIATA
jgi:hypothetical protein